MHPVMFYQIYKMEDEIQTHDRRKQTKNIKYQHVEHTAKKMSAQQQFISHLF